MIKSHEIKNVTDFNVADSVRCDIKVLVTKTCYTVKGYEVMIEQKQTKLATFCAQIVKFYRPGHMLRNLDVFTVYYAIQFV